MRPRQPQIDEIMDWFDFDKVHKAMVALDWHWASSNGVPSIQELRVQARELLNQTTGYLATGGFVAEREDDGTLSLGFYVSQWSGDRE